MKYKLTERESITADIFLDFLLTLEKDSAFKSVVNFFFKEYNVSKERILLICKYLEIKHLVKVMLDQNEELRNLTFDRFKIKDFIKNERIHKIWLTENKLKNDFKLSSWQVKTFWPLFIFAFIGSTLSIYNFINNSSSLKNVKHQEQRMNKMEVELSKLHISILNQKKEDSLRIAKDTID